MIRFHYVYLLQNKIKSLALVSGGGVGAFTAINIFNENEDFYDDFVMPLIHRLEPETSHNLAIFACKHGLFPKTRFKDPPNLVKINYHT
jgi:dihydroorotate dehydrogenase